MSHIPLNCHTTHLDKACRRYEKDKDVGQLLDPAAQQTRGRSGGGPDARGALERVHHELAAVAQEAHALDDVVLAAADDGGAHDARDRDEEAVQFFERLRLVGV